LRNIALPIHAHWRAVRRTLPLFCLGISVFAAVPAIGAADNAAQPAAAAAPAANPLASLPDPLDLIPKPAPVDDPRTQSLLNIGKQIRDLAQYSNGPGLIVCQPQVTDAALRDFANGCGAWLHVAAAGRVEFDRTPQLSSLSRVLDELRTSDLALGETDARELGRLFGVTQFAIGKLSGDGDNLTLTYHVYPIASRVAPGKDWTLTGNKAAIVAALPGLADNIAQAAGGSTTPAASISLTADDLALLGRLFLRDSTAIASAADCTRLADLESKDPLAAVCYWRFGRANQTQLNHSVDHALKAAAPNPLLILEATLSDRPYVTKERLPVDTLFVSHKQNYLLATAETLIERESHYRVAERKAAEATVRSSTTNPEAWRTLGATINIATTDLWHSRAPADLNDAERAASARLRQDSFTCFQKCSQLDTHYGAGCLDLSTSAEDQGQRDVALKAFWDAVALDPEKCNVFAWGLSLYGPGHMKDGGKRQLIAKLATRMDVKLALAMSDTSDPKAFVVTLRGARFKDEAAALKTSFQTELAAQAQAQTDNADPRIKLAKWSELDGDWQKALTLYREAIKIDPLNGAAYCSAADMLDKLDKTDDAIAQYRKALEVDPDEQNARYGLAWDLKHTEHFAEAEKVLNEALLAEPFSAPHHYALAVTYRAGNKLDPAITEFQRTLELDPSFDAYAELCGALYSAARYDDAVRVARQALNVDPYNADVINTTTAVFLKKNEPGRGQLLAQYAIQLNEDDPQAHENLAEAYMQLNKIPQARDEWSKVVKLDDPATTKIAKDFLAKYPG